jgi:indole-3-glycerol phosphate synthase
MDDFLSKIIDSVRARNEAMKAALGPNDTARLVAARPDTPRGFLAALGASSGRTKVVAEIKRASPTTGVIRDDIDPGWLARDWEKDGAAAISVLTERNFFHGSVEDLQAAREATRLPVLRRDYIIDPYQVPRSYGTGADAITVVFRAVPDDNVLFEIYDSAANLRLDVLTEIYDSADAERALRLGERCPNALRLVGVNSRDPATGETDLTRPAAVAPLFPESTALMCLSGVKTRADIDAVRASCPRLSRFLVGEALMRSEDPGMALRALLKDGNDVQSAH